MRSLRNVFIAELHTKGSSVPLMRTALAYSSGRTYIEDRVEPGHKWVTD